MNAVPGRGQTFVDTLIARVFPASTADGFQSVESEAGPELPQPLRLQWSNFGNDEKMTYASRVLLIRFHVKLLLAFILFMICSGTLASFVPLTAFHGRTAICEFVNRPTSVPHSLLVLFLLSAYSSQFSF